MGGPDAFPGPNILALKCTFLIVTSLLMNGLLFWVTGALMWEVPTPCRDLTFVPQKYLHDSYLIVNEWTLLGHKGFHVGGPDALSRPNICASKCASLMVTSLAVAFPFFLADDEDWIGQM